MINKVRTPTGAPNTSGDHTHSRKREDSSAVLCGLTLTNVCLWRSSCDRVKSCNFNLQSFVLSPGVVNSARCQLQLQKSSFPKEASLGASVCCVEKLKVSFWSYTKQNFKILLCFMTIRSWDISCIKETNERYWTKTVYHFRLHPRVPTAELSHRYKDLQQLILSLISMAVAWQCLWSVAFIETSTNEQGNMKKIHS